MYTGARMCRHGTLTFFIGRTCVSFAKASTSWGDSKEAGLKSGQLTFLAANISVKPGVTDHSSSTICQMPLIALRPLHSTIEF